MQTVNEKGGIDVGGSKYNVEILHYDDESKADTAARLTEKLISEDKAQFILGPFSSGITQATSTISERYGVLTIAPRPTPTASTSAATNTSSRSSRPPRAISAA